MVFELLIKGVNPIDVCGERPRSILALCEHSKQAEKECLFFCLNSNSSSGVYFVKEAQRRGAVAVVTEKKLNLEICQVIVSDIKSAMATICKNFYGNPQEDMRIIALVGTNGKTSTCHILSEMFKEDGYNVGVTGTIGTYYSGKFYDSPLTTLGTIDLYKLISQMSLSGVEVFIMELSAHAIYQRRAEGLYFDGLVFTNCTEDHLDYFNDMQEYKQVKKSAFDKSRSKYMVINSDDGLGVEIINSVSGKIITYGIDNPADVFAINVEENQYGIKYVVNLFDIIFEVNCSLYGICNVYNTLGACAIAGVMGVNISAIESALKKLKPVEGRAEPVCDYNGGKVFVDYAHTPDGLYRTLSSMKKICKGKLICLFGCGGNREREKRPQMGKISGEIADFTVITSDNPRYEDAVAIINEIESGLKDVTRNYIAIKDRKNAVLYSLDKIKEGDFLVICGKGAEKYQEIMGEKFPFNDKTLVLERLALLKE